MPRETNSAMSSRSTRSDHKWAFKTRFRRNAFGWRSQPAIQRINQAVSEIKSVARKDPMLAAEGAVAFIERLVPAIEAIDSSSGAIGSAVNRAIDALTAIIAAAPEQGPRRESWLARLWQAYQDDGMGYLDGLGDGWDQLCATIEIATKWADELAPILRAVRTRAPAERSYFHGAGAAYGALFAAQRYDELLELLELDGGGLWDYRRWGFKALAAQGRRAEALRYAQRFRDERYGEEAIARDCEALLLASGFADEAYERYALQANQEATNLATFRAITKKYPGKNKQVILRDLVASTPGMEGKWFAAAKSAGLLDEAIALARLSPTDSKTLARAARDFSEINPAFALEASLTGLDWLAQGYGYEITVLDVQGLCASGLYAAERIKASEQFMVRLRAIAERADQFVREALKPFLRQQ